VSYQYSGDYISPKMSKNFLEDGNEKWQSMENVVWRRHGRAYPMDKCFGNGWI